MIKRTKPNQLRKREDPTVASEKLLNSIDRAFDKTIPVPYLTGITKKHGKQLCLEMEDKFIQRFVQTKGLIDTKKLTDYLKTSNNFHQGKPLSEDAVRRVYHNSSNSEGKLTFEYLIKMGEEVGVPISEKQAKDMIRMYGKRKTYLSVEDCLRMNDRRTKPNRSASKSATKPRR